MIADRPSPPRNVRPTEIQKDYIVVSWDESEFDGGSPITGYIVEKQDVKRQSWIQVSQRKIKLEMFSDFASSLCWIGTATKRACWYTSRNFCDKPRVK